MTNVIHITQKTAGRLLDIEITYRGETSLKETLAFLLC